MAHSIPTPEDAVRRYLLHRVDPSLLVDHDRRRKLEATLADTPADDVLARVAIQQEILACGPPPATTLERHFIEHAAAWATPLGVTADAFVAEGVPRNIADAALNGRAPGGTSDATSDGYTSAEDTAAMMAPGDVWSVTSLMETAGCSKSTAYRLLKEAVAEGRATKVGPDPDWDRPGRAPALYKLH